MLNLEFLYFCSPLLIFFLRNKNMLQYELWYYLILSLSFAFISMLFFSSFSTAEDAFLSAIINYTNSSTVHFKLSPTYVLYMTCRYVLSSQYRPDITPTERTHKVIAIVNKMVNMMEGVIQVSFFAKMCQGI